MNAFGHQDPTAPARCIAVIADLIRSRRYSPAERASIQQRINTVLEQLNEQYRESVLARFLITAGDEFQGLLSNASVLADMIWDIEADLRQADFRVGVGCGFLSTPLQDRTVDMDGPVWYAARDAVGLAKSSRRQGGVFLGFGQGEDAVLNGFARLLRELRGQWTARQFEVIQLLRQGKSQVEVAEVMGVSKQAVSKHAKSTGWDAYVEGERAWKQQLGSFDFTPLWNRR